MKEQIRQFIISEMIRDMDYALEDDEPLITGGLVDSFSLVELGLFIEETFGIHVDDVDLAVTNMDTLNSIVQFLQSKI